MQNVLSAGSNATCKDTQKNVYLSFHVFFMDIFQHYSSINHYWVPILDNYLSVINPVKPFFTFVCWLENIIDLNSSIFSRLHFFYKQCGVMCASVECYFSCLYYFLCAFIFWKKNWQTSLRHTSVQPIVGQVRTPESF